MQTTKARMGRPTDTMRLPILTAVINATLKEWIGEGRVADARQVNNGLCEDFAVQVRQSPWHVVNGLFAIKILHSEEFKRNGRWDMAVLEHWGIELPKGLHAVTGEHTFLHFADLFFDSECPQGTPNFFDLPFFQRYLKD